MVVKSMAKERLHNYESKVKAVCVTCNEEITKAQIQYQGAVRYAKRTRDEAIAEMKREQENERKR